MEIVYCHACPVDYVFQPCGTGPSSSPLVIHRPLQNSRRKVACSICVPVAGMLTRPEVTRPRPRPKPPGSRPRGRPFITSPPGGGGEGVLTKKAEEKTKLTVRNSLRKYNISKLLINCIESLYQDAKSAVMCEGTLSSWFNTTSLIKSLIKRRKQQ